MSEDPHGMRIVPPSRRRDKPILSCTLCRRRKLKCDRLQPCKTCVDRGLSLSCAYVRSAPPSKEPKVPNSVHDRINQLEKLVTNLISGNDIHHASPAASTISQYQYHNGNHDADLPGTPDRVKFQGETTTYSNSGHWTSILDGISELREHLDHIPESPSPKDELHEDIPGPELLFGRHTHATKEQILASLPPKSEADDLLETFFQSMDTHPTILHKPTFLKQYQNFWAQPFKTSVMWIGLLYAVLAIGFRFKAAIDNHGRDGSELPSDTNLTLHSARMTFYREKVVQCMILANYTKCPPFTIETVLCYFGTEFLRTQDTQFSMYILVGMLTRLAFRMGYHRDASRFPNISPFRGELRRRKWVLIMSLDLVTSSQVGLPRIIQPFMYDTQEPRNLHEDDLHEDISELPPSRPEIELTQLLYSIFLTRIRRQQAQIVDMMNSTSQPTYREIMDIDTTLGHIRDSIPQASKPVVLDNGDATTLPESMRRLYLELAILKARLMLHRPYLKLGRTDAKYDYSRRVCLNVAMEMLRFQRMLDRGLTPGGKLGLEVWRVATVSWYMSAIVAQDFLLATTVLILDLDEDLVSPMPQNAHLVRDELQLDGDAPTREDIIVTLRSAYAIWTKASRKSQEAFKVAAAVKLVLSKAENSTTQVNGSPHMNLGRDQMNFTSPTPSFDFNDMSPAAPGSDVFSLGHGSLSHAFDLGNMSMDLDGFAMPYNWGGIPSELQNLQMQPSEEFHQQQPYDYGSTGSAFRMPQYDNREMTSNDEQDSKSIAPLLNKFAP
ncbi:fungal specific transcription factor domain containing protein [Pyrenophora tritici-repentis]|nr:fungal specific transcription factor domain-containing protein [Pyrenophora tritici-repentis]KAI0615645.1 fungal specific transcription factor domain-containing protein [Pyrenophora tritici-repentis]KAI2485288.1 fungal specific transcription factor domain containing protein [Pyrenophora tritici-repentis]